MKSVDAKRNPDVPHSGIGITQRSRILAYLSIAFAAALLAVPLSGYGQTSDTWKGGAGNWSNASLWTAGVPNGNVNVFIDGGNSLLSPVTLDITSTINNLTIDSDDSLSFSDNHSLTVNGTSISNAGNISLNSGNNPTELIIGSSNVTLSGGGTLTMGNNANNLIFGSAGTNKLTNQETIQGAGNIGDGQMTLVNSGTINANAGVGQNALTIQTSGGTTNTGTIEATNGSTLILTGASGGNFTNTGGTIQALNSSSGPSVVALENGVTITGGTLTTTGNGIIETPGGHTATLNGVTNTGTYSVNDNSVTILSGTITNTGALQLNSGNNPTDFKISGNVTLSGLNGTLNISLISGFVPTIGSTFQILNYSSETGTFSTVNGLSINSNEHFTISYLGTDVLLTVVAGPSGSAASGRSGLLRGLHWPGGLAAAPFPGKPIERGFATRLDGDMPEERNPARVTKVVSTPASLGDVPIRTAPGSDLRVVSRTNNLLAATLNAPAENSFSTLHFRADSAIKAISGAERLSGMYLPASGTSNSYALPGGYNSANTLQPTSFGDRFPRFSVSKSLGTQLG